MQENNTNPYANKSIRWLRKAIKQNWLLLKAYDYNYSCEKPEDIPKLEKNSLFKLFSETKLMQKDLSMRLGRV